MKKLLPLMFTTALLLSSGAAMADHAMTPPLRSGIPISACALVNNTLSCDNGTLALIGDAICRDNHFAGVSGFPAKTPHSGDVEQPAISPESPTTSWNLIKNDNQDIVSDIRCYATHPGD